MERKNVTVMITLNLSMVFDTVDHKVLLSNLPEQLWHKWNSTRVVYKLLESQRYDSENWEFIF